ncbi:hypothetical protein ASE85_22115 [Sphingobium sp. Leaf26]|uniref:hypothetical protein n=1 Tax=Sphingobium sp. Leaf26 TaxID=1735693 RepID=UPI000701CED5|nr:hypothetical protein [Sphingobium sp. Leaf26]KQN00101.1 hypothetical protein ASE85_22115 [Sphingobium sp. Leaf26]
MDEDLRAFSDHSGSYPHALAEREGDQASFNKEARQRYLAFATSGEAGWPGNFRDLAASVTRMATLSPKGRINVDCVDKEIERLRRLWLGQADNAADILSEILSDEQIAELDLFDRVQLTETIKICCASRSLSEAGRTLFNASRARRSSSNDADRLRKYLARFDLEWSVVNDLR